MRSPKLRLTLLILIAGVTSVFSQPPAPPGGTTGGPSCWPPPCVPIDGGITILMAAGAAYGAKKIHDSRKKSATIK